MAVKGKISLKQLLKKEFANSKVFQNLAYGAVKKKADALKRKPWLNLINTRLPRSWKEEHQEETVSFWGVVETFLVF